MTHTVWITAAFLSVLSVSAIGETEQKRRAAGITAFLHVNVVPMDRELVLPDQTVIVRGDRIVEIGPAATLKVPVEATRIDGRGKYLMPGLADMHAHVMEKDQLILFVTNGVTTVRNMSGEPKHIEWRNRIVEANLLGPTIYTAGPIVDGDPPVWPTSVVITKPEQASTIVAEQKEAGYDFLKVYNNLTVEAYDALTQAAGKQRIPVAGHVPVKVGLEHVLKARQRCIEHLDGYETALASDDCASARKNNFASLILAWLELDEQKIPNMVRETREAGTWNCPTLIVYDKWIPPDEANVVLERDEFRYLSPAELDYHRPGNNYLKPFTPEMFEAVAAGKSARRKLTKALHDGGARILLGTDCANPLIVPGFSLHEELQNFVDAGLTPYEAIKAGTHDAAEFFDALDEWGTVAAGRRADLILLDANPLDDVANVAKRIGVMVRGKWYPQNDLQAKLDALAEKYAKAKIETATEPPEAEVE